MGALDTLWQNLDNEFAKVISRFKDEVAKLRVGAVDVENVKQIQVDAYGSMMPIYQIATVMSQGATTIVITPWDKKLLEHIAKALDAEFEDITPAVRGESVYLNFPPITEEKKKEFLKLISKNAENYRQQLRDIRNDYKKKLEDMKKDGDLPENDFYKAMEQLDETTRKFRDEIDSIYKAKEKQFDLG